MEYFLRANAVQLRSHHRKYLLADDDANTCTVKNALWTVEFDENYDDSYYGRYLTASEDHHILGVTGQKVIQSVPLKIDSSVEWEPVLEGCKVRLKTRYRNYLRANGGVPPWRNSITHDIPHRHHNWILWEVEVVEIRLGPLPKKSNSSETDLDLEGSFHLTSIPISQESNLKNEGRMIHYKLVDDDGELTQNLEEETELENITVCSRSPLNGKLYLPSPASLCRPITQLCTSFRKNEYEVDHCYHQNEDTALIFSVEVKPHISKVFDGESSTFIAFGARGTGKTYTIQGSKENVGLGMMVMDEILKMVEGGKHAVAVSIFEVFQDHVYDILDSKNSEVRVLEDAQGKIILKKGFLRQGKYIVIGNDLVFVGTCEIDVGISETILHGEWFEQVKTKDSTGIATKQP
ncbi:Actin cross-linking [Cynara cardunculus var. scolymus]|uniref:Actin cross-linking n=1 Tax=Cynara cardunculus var. scolymus TaxID=59895 RepID=A0A103XP75_CYNCS|nr:Actin cross-linking [Cynara cardunculus var. scolymus]